MKNGRIITIINQKGGVGKTTTISALARIYSQKGMKVLVLSLDPQQNIDMVLAKPISRADTSTPNMYHVLTGQKNLEECIVPGTCCDIVLASNQLYSWTGEQIIRKEDYDAVKDDPEKLRALMDQWYDSRSKMKRDYDSTHLLKQQIMEQKLLEKYDLILCDVAPSLSLLALNGLTAATLGYVVIPVFHDEFSRFALTELYNSIQAINYNEAHSIKIAGILMTRYVKNTKISKRYERYLEIAAKKMGTILFNTKIRRCISASEFFEAGTDLIDYDPKCPASLDYVAFGEELLARMKQLEQA